MGEKMLVIGESGGGKSTSGRNLDPKETFWIRVVKKPLPFKGWKSKYSKMSKDTPSGNMIDLHKAEDILKTLRYISSEKKDIKVIIIDDLQYVMSLEFVARAKEKGFDKFSELTQKMVQVLMEPDDLREDLTVIFLTHCEDVSGNGFTKTKMKTVGKMLDEKVTPEGLFTVVLQSVIQTKGKDDVEYLFCTQSDGTTPVKTPMGMFDSKYIPNDLKYVLEKIEEYNG